MAKTAVSGDSPKRRNYSDISVNKMSPAGGYEVSSMVNGYLHSKQFQGYSKRDAMKNYHDDRQKEQGK
jgi:hypothetical protein